MYTLGMTALLLANIAISQDTGRCLQNPVHLSEPRDFGAGTFPDRSCPPYERNACCSEELMEEVAGFNTTRLYNFDWAHCGPISDRCEQFLLAEECMYQCSPRVAYWPGDTEWAIDRVPVCGDFCDDWFSACRDDLTCATDWLTGFHVDDNGVYSCREDSPCRTFADVYTDGRGLCNAMWGESFKYMEKEETEDSINCLTMWWEAGQPSPNEKFALPSPDGAKGQGERALGAAMGAVISSGLLALVGGLAR